MPKGSYVEGKKKKLSHSVELKGQIRTVPLFIFNVFLYV